MCVGVATVARATQEQYVRATIGSLLHGLLDHERDELFLMLFIAHTDPNVHPIYHEPWIRSVSNKVLTYDIPESDLSRLKMFEGEHHPRNKSMYDYRYLLQNCLQTEARYIAIVEDDVIARHGWYGMAKDSMQSIRDRKEDSNWLYLRMFYTETLLGWNSEEVFHYLGWSALALGVLLFMLLGLRYSSRSLARHFTNQNILLLCFVCLPAFIGLFFMAGRMTMHPLPPGVYEMPRFGCCSQGLIFPREIVPQVIERTKKAMDEDYYIDMLLERYADAEDLKRFVHYPSLLQHIGLESSKGAGYDANAHWIWNFGFETDESVTREGHARKNI